MAALDRFEWYVSSQLKQTGSEGAELIRRQRAYLLTLRSEDERQRAVEEAITELNDRLRPSKK